MSVCVNKCGGKDGERKRERERAKRNYTNIILYSLYTGNSWLETNKECMVSTLNIKVSY